MIFTVGRKAQYDGALEAYKDDPHPDSMPKKAGKSEGFPGGSVWRTAPAAFVHCPPDFDVYGVRATWGKQTKKDPEGPWHNLLVDSEFVLLPPRFRQEAKK